MLSNKAILNDTLRIIEDGYYTKDEQLIMLKYSTEESQESIVILPDEVKQIYNKCFDKGNKYSSDCNSKCFNLDSFSLGIKTKKDYNSNRVLVLNFANPINPGGGVRIGAKAQEEGQPIKFCVNNNHSSNNRILNCGAIRLSDLSRVNYSFLFVECYARLA